MVEFRHEFHDTCPGLRVEISRGFVAQEDIRVVDEGAGYSDPLLLAPGEFQGSMGIETFVKLDSPEYFPGLLLVNSSPEHLGKTDIFDDV